MGPTNFVQTTRTIKAGQTLLFDDTYQGGGLHIICMGKDQQCDTSADGSLGAREPGIHNQSRSHQERHLSNRGDLPDHLYGPLEYEPDGDRPVTHRAYWYAA